MTLKQSLQKAISLFSISEQLLIGRAILSLKLKRKIPPKAEEVFATCDKYVQLIEKGAGFKKAGNKLIRASIVINKRPVSVFLRNRSSDLNVFHSVIVNEEYKIAAEKLLRNESTFQRIIIDAGANIGLATIYLHSYYPGAKFIIIEPDEKNFEILKMNLQENNITSVVLFKNALWTSGEKLKIDNSFRDGKEWSLSVTRAGSDSPELKESVIKGITLMEICSLANINHIDLLKIDIEGAERFLFDDEDFLKTIKAEVNAIIIEIHDEFNIRNSINSKMDAMGFEKIETKSLTLFHKIIPAHEIAAS